MNLDESPVERASPRAAHEDLQYIRRTLAASGHLSTVPGKGMVAIGLLALGATWLNRDYTGAPWEGRPYNGPALLIWVALLVIAFAIGAGTMSRKARITGQAFWSPVLRKALWGYGAALALGAVLSISVIRAGHVDLLAEVWLGCYGVGLIGAGAVSVSPVRWMGVCFLLLATTSAYLPSEGLALLAVGFGWLHVAFGAYIAWRHNG